MNSEGDLALGKALLVENVADTKPWKQNVLGMFNKRRKTRIVLMEIMLGLN